MFIQLILTIDFFNLKVIVLFIVFFECTCTFNLILVCSVIIIDTVILCI